MNLWNDYEAVDEEDLMDYFTDPYKHAMLPWEDPMGMKVTSGSVTLEKDPENMVGISIGGGAPGCPCLYIVQVFEKTPAYKDKSLASGDEIVGINGTTVKGRTKHEVARMIQNSKDRVTINYNKLHADPDQGKTMDLILKKVKHRMVEWMNSETADALGLSRAILCNDSMIKKLDEMQRNARSFSYLRILVKKFLQAFLLLSRVHREFGNVFSEIGVRESNKQAYEAFTKFGESHREMEKNGLKAYKTLKPTISDLQIFLEKAIPDTKLTLKKYLDVKFEYLSYCLKVKEMDDEEVCSDSMHDPLYRVETGNYEYRLILRCRQEAKVKFSKMRSDVLIKLELLDNKHVQDLVFQLQRFVSSLACYLTDNYKVMKETQLFPVDIDLSSYGYHFINKLGEEEEEEEENNEEIKKDLGRENEEEGEEREEYRDGKGGAGDGKGEEGNELKGKNYDCLIDFDIEDGEENQKFFQIFEEKKEKINKNNNLFDCGFDFNDKIKSNPMFNNTNNKQEKNEEDEEDEDDSEEDEEEEEEEDDSDVEEEDEDKKQKKPNDKINKNKNIKILSNENIGNLNDNFLNLNEINIDSFDIKNKKEENKNTNEDDEEEEDEDEDLLGYGNDEEKIIFDFMNKSNNNTTTNNNNNSRENTNKNICSQVDRFPASFNDNFNENNNNNNNYNYNYIDNSMENENFEKFLK